MTWRASHETLPPRCRGICGHGRIASAAAEPGDNDRHQDRPHFLEKPASGDNGVGTAAELRLAESALSQESAVLRGKVLGLQIEDGIVPWDKVNGRPQLGKFRNQVEYILWGTKGKRDFSSATKYHEGILKYMIPMGNARQHATQKPLDLMKRLVE